MARAECLYKIDRMLNDRKVVGLTEFLEELEVSLATFKCDLECPCNRFNALVVWVSDVGK